LAATIALAQRSAGSSRAAVDLGREQPIEASERRPDHHERRNLSFRWLSGAVLTGLCGVALVGSALYLGFDRESNFAEAPELATTRSTSAQETGVNPGKGDRLVRPVDIVAAKQTFRAATTIKVGDKEVVKPRLFTHVSTTLTTTPTGFAGEVPEFNPLKLTSGATEEPDQPTDPGPAVQDDADVAFTTRDLTNSDAVLVADRLTAAEAQAEVAESLRAFTAAKNAPPIPPQLLLMRASRAGLDPVGGLAYAAAGSVGANAPFASIDVRMVPENVTNVPRSPTAYDAEASERLIVLRHGENLGDLLTANGAGKIDADKIVAAFGARNGGGPIADGQKALLTFAEADGQRPRKIARISLYADEQLKATVAANDSGDYVAVTLPPAAAKKTNPDDNGDGMSLYESVYQTVLKQGVPKPIIEEMVKAFANDVDFQRSVTAGDSVEAFYSEPDEVDSRPELLFGLITARDQTFRYYRFQTPDDGRVDYYDDNGRSVRKFLLRKPILAGEITSPFGMRYHPILHYARMHTGVDWANAPGTPILAAGNGVIIKAGAGGAGEQGYGRRIEIQHANGYVTTYSHLSGFARGIVEGAHVNQGQVIGYLGQSGLATGPHIHYEVIVNGRFVDPMAIKLARTREFDGKMLAAFKRERDRIDQLMGQAPNAAPIAQAPGAPPGPTPVAQKIN
jgi:murein DD-endopeptidase MepM/ murein hydrolase activator NlpD